MARHTPETKAAQAFLSALSNINFQPNVFAVLVEMAPANLQERMLEVFYAYIDILAMKHDEKLYNRQEKAVCERAKKIQTILNNTP